MHTAPPSVVLAAILFLASGCAFIVPRADSGPHALNEINGRVGTPDDPLANVRSRRDVLLALGEPDRCWQDQRCFAYICPDPQVTMGFMLPGIVPLGASGTVCRNYILLWQFDHAGAVCSHRLVELGEGVPDSLDAACEQFAAGTLRGAGAPTPSAYRTGSTP